MKEKIEQFRLKNYTINVDHEDERITCFSITEEPEPNKTRTLMWKCGTGFNTCIGKYDPRANYDIVKPIDPAEFPDADVVRLLREHPEIFQQIPRAQLIGMSPEVLPQHLIMQLKAQLVTILEQK